MTDPQQRPPGAGRGWDTSNASGKRKRFLPREEYFENEDGVARVLHRRRGSRSKKHRGLTVNGIREFLEYSYYEFVTL